MSNWTFKQKKEAIEYKLKSINETLETNYQVDYVPCYGGFCIYNEHNGRGYLGTWKRMKADEMIAYLEGIQNTICLIIDNVRKNGTDFYNIFFKIR